MDKRKRLQIGDNQFEYVNAVEIKELSAKYLIGQYVGSDKSIILRILIDGDNYIIDASKRSEQEKEVLSRYFMAHDHGTAFKEAIEAGLITSFYYDMPDIAEARREVITSSVNDFELPSLKSPIISKTKFEIPPASYKVGEDKFLELKEINNLIINLQKELDRYHDNMRRLENNG
ncbi:MAG: hypothetical protein V8Q75_04485 [Bacilli bacterium]